MPCCRLEQSLAGIRHFADVPPVAASTHARPGPARRDQLPTDDAMIAAAALLAGCTTLMSEHFQAGRVFDRSPTVHNTLS